MEPFLAIAFARLHNRDPTKREREFVKIGVGKNTTNIAEWVDQLWALFWFEEEDQYYNCNF